MLSTHCNIQIQMGGLYLIRMKVHYLLFIWIENTKPDPDPDPEVATSARFYLMCCLLIAKTGSVIWYKKKYTKIHTTPPPASLERACTCGRISLCPVRAQCAWCTCIGACAWLCCVAWRGSGVAGCRAPCVMAVVVYALVRLLCVVVIILHKTKQGKGLRVLELHSACQHTELPLRHKHTGYGIGCISYVT